MANKNILSFTDYIANRFDNDFWNATSHFKPSLTSSKLRSIGETTIEDIEVITVWTKETDNYLSIDVAVKITYELLEGDHHYDDYDIQTKWMMCYCKASFDKDLDDFKIVRTEEYFPHSNSSDDLSDSLIPYIKKDDLENVAEDFLQRYYPQALKITKVGEKPVAINPNVLACNMGLTVLSHCIKEDGSVFGRIYFNDTDTELYDDTSKRNVLTHIDANTIVVDPHTYYLRTVGTFNNTIIHECVHFDKHYKAFKLAQLYNKETSCISCETTEDFNIPINKNSGWFMEWQANQLAPRIQMPAKPFKSKAEEYINKHVKSLVIENPNRNVYKHEAMESVIKELASDFGVSIQSAKIRLIELGFEDAIGTFNYVDDHYVKPHSFKKGSIELNQTFTISFWDACYQSTVDQNLKAKLDESRYVFVENHFVFNSPLYVYEGELTNYARAHMDECCLAFELKARNHQIDKILYTVCYLNKENTDVQIDISYYAQLSNNPQEKQIEYILNHQKEETEIYNKMTEDRKQCLDLLLDWRKMNRSELAFSAGIALETLSRITDAEAVTKRSTIILICLALNLPYQISEKLLRIFGVPLVPGNMSHLSIMKILQFCYLDDIQLNIERLNKLGVDIEGKKNI